MSYDSAEAKAFLKREADTVEEALQHITGFEELYRTPTPVAGDVLIGYLQSINTLELTPELASLHLRERLQKLQVKLRTKLARLSSLTLERAAILLHLGLVLGADELDKLSGLWKALAEEDYEAAHDVVMMSDWPRLVGTDQHSRRRVLMMARVLRTGDRRKNPRKP